MMRILKSMADYSFKTGETGETYFYPWGVIGKGYVLPSKEREEQIRNFLYRCNIVGLVVGVPCLLIFLETGFWLPLLLIPLFFGVSWLAGKRFTKGLKDAPVKLTFSDNMRRFKSSGNK